MKDVVARFLRSPVTLGLLGVEAFLFLCLALLRLLSPLSALAFFAVCGAVSSLVFLMSPAGGRVVAAEADRERSDRDARFLASVAVARKRLSLLRIENPAMKAALDRVVASAGRYLEVSVRGADRDPQIEDAVLSAVEVIEDYLQMLNAASSARRTEVSSVQLDLQGKGPSDPGPLLERSCRALAACADTIDQRLDEISGHSAEDRLKAREELR